MLSTRNKVQAVVSRLLLAVALLMGLLGPNPGPVTYAAPSLAAEPPADAATPAPIIAPVPAMLPPQAPQLDPVAPPPAPSLTRNRQDQVAPVVDHMAARFAPPASSKDLISKTSLPSQAGLAVQAAGAGDLPNLVMYQPPGWADFLVLSTQTGTNSNEVLFEGNAVYLDWAVVNEGADTPTSFSTCVYIDNEATVDTCWIIDGGLNLGFYTAIEDWLVNQSPAAGWHLIGLWTDVYDEVAESNEDDNYVALWFYWYPAGNSLNLTPYVPDGWDNPVVPASEPGPTGNRSLYADTPTYFDTAFANYGTQAAPEFTTCLDVDYVEQYCDRTALDANFYLPYEDHEVTIATSGWHTVTLRVDVLDEVAEANEDDNVWEASFLWEGSSKPNLHAYQPDGWDNAIVVSSLAGTHSADPLQAGAPAYLDWFFVNDGAADISAAFDVELYIDGVLKETWPLAGGLPRGYYTGIEDYVITLPAGSHLLEMRADTANTISESNEADNTHLAEFFWNEVSGRAEINIQPPTSLSIGVTTQEAVASIAINLPRSRASVRSADVRTYGKGALLSPPTQGVYPPVPLAVQSADQHLSNVDLSAGLPPVGDQFQTLACVGWSSSYYYKTFQERADQGWSATLPTHQFAPNFVWNQGQPNATGPCTGMYPATALEILSSKGAVPINLLPFSGDPQSCRLPITTAQQDEAAKYRAQNFGPFFTYGTKPTDAIIDQMKAWLSSGDPLLISINATPEFQKPAGAQCVVDLPSQACNGNCGHAITVVGYNDDNFYAPGGAFKIVNSWGTSYGCGGFAWLSYRWFKENAQEAWWMRDIRTGGNVARDFTITNSGTRSLVVSEITTHANPETWLQIVPPVAISPSQPMIIEPGQSKTVAINVLSGGLPNNSYTGLIDITSNDPFNPVKTLRVYLTVGVPPAAAPPPAGNAVPADGATGQSPSGVTVEWQPVVPVVAAGAASIVYDVRMDTSSPPAETRCNDVTTTNCAVTNLKPNTTYFWRVVAADGLNASLGPIWSFTTGSQVTEPTPTATATQDPLSTPTATATVAPIATATPTPTVVPNAGDGHQMYLPFVSR